MLVEVLQVEQSDPEQLLGSCVVDDCVEIAQQNITSFIEMGDVSGTLGSSLIKRIKIYGKKGESALDAFFLRWLHASGRFGTFCVPKCRTIPFFGRFLESCYIAHPRTRAKVPEKPVRGHEIGGRIVFRQKKCCTIRNLPRKSESCNEIRRFLPWFLISWQVLAASAFQYPTVCMIKESVRLTLYRPRGFLLAKS